MAQSYLLMNILNFCFFYCNFVPSIICSGFVNIFVLISSSLVYEQHIDINIVAMFIVLLIF